MIDKSRLYEIICAIVLINIPVVAVISAIFFPAGNGTIEMQLATRFMNAWVGMACMTAILLTLAMMLPIAMGIVESRQHGYVQWVKMDL